MSATACQGCRDGAGFATPFSMAFQPIVDLGSGEVFAYEALVRGEAGQGAREVLDQVDDANRYAFDQACRVKAIQLASGLGVADRGALVSINFLPNAVYEPRACIRATLAATAATGFPVGAVLFEFTECEKVDDAHLKHIVQSYKAMGFKTAIDDFGAGYSGLSRLIRFQPDIVKLDMDLIRGLHTDRVRRTLVGAVVRACEDLGVIVLAEGVEAVDESRALRDLGVDLQQGYLYAKPAFEALPEPLWAAGAAALAA